MLWSAAEDGGRAYSSPIYLRCVVKAVPMAMAAGAANLLAGVWAATGRWLAGSTARGRGQRGRYLRRRRDCCAILCANMVARVRVGVSMGGVESLVVYAAAVWTTMLSLQSTWDAPAFRPHFSAHCLAPRQPIAEEALVKPEQEQAARTQNPRLPAAELFLSLSSRTSIQPSGLHEGAVGATPARRYVWLPYCPSRFRDELLPVVNRTSDIKLLSKMCFISGKHALLLRVLCSCCVV